MSVNLAAVGSVTFTGLNGAGSVAVPGLKVGDYIGPAYITYIAGPSSGATGVIDPASNQFESVVTVDDQIQQKNSGDLSIVSLVMFFFRAA